MKNVHAKQPGNIYALLSGILLKSLMIISLPLNAFAQETEESTENTFGNEGRWYQVEIILFSQSDSTNSEVWDTNIALSYPPNWKRLDVIDAEQDAEYAQLILASEAFYQLPESEHLLNNNARDLNNAKQHRVLFHKAWRQPVWSKDEAPSLIISGGDKYGEHFELSGSINLSVARYLHLDTNLWFTQFENNFGQELKDWPTLPTPPSIEADINIENKELQPYKQTTLWESAITSNNEYDSILATPYVAVNIIKLNQKRRMRSKEIHYIDHPTVGMIIYIVPYELPESLEPELNAETENVGVDNEKDAIN
jgi:hypothetical protein